VRERSVMDGSEVMVLSSKAIIKEINLLGLIS
jgi:hypothetical protein